MKKLCIIVSLILALMMAAGAVAAPQIAADEYPIVDGSTATLPLSYALMQQTTGVTEQEAKDIIRHSKTTESFYELVSGMADILLVYAPSADAFEFAKENNVELEMKSIGRDALVFLVNDQNPVDNLTHEQLVKIYSGEITNWSEVGGDNLDIIAYQRIANSGSQVMMEAQVMGDTPMTDAPTELRPGEMSGLVDVVASYNNKPSAIGYSVYYYIHNMYMNETLKMLSVDGVAPTNEAIASGLYPYGQDFYAVIRKDAAEDSPERKLYDYLSTPEGIALIEQAGYVPIVPEDAMDVQETSDEPTEADAQSSENK